MTPDDLVRIRKLMGWTHTQAAAKAGVSATTWTRWESGEVHPHPLRIPLLSWLLRLAERHAAKNPLVRAAR